MNSTDCFMHIWLVGYSAVMEPLEGILLTNFYLIHPSIKKLLSGSSTVLGVEDLYLAWLVKGLRILLVQCVGIHIRC